MIASITPILLLGAFVLLLLVSISVPIIKTIYLMKVVANLDADIINASADGSARFGVFGYCLDSVKVSVAGISGSSASECSPAKLGYDFDNTISSALGIDNGLKDTLSRALTAALVLHPIACGLTFLAFLVSLFILRRGSNGTSRLPSLLTLIIGILAALLTTVVFLIDVILVAVVRKRIRDETEGQLSVTWGNGVWMALGATVALWLAMVAACCGICACGGRRYRKETY